MGMCLRKLTLLQKLRNPRNICNKCKREKDVTVCLNWDSLSHHLLKYYNHLSIILLRLLISTGLDT